jgi:hypothetical protein
MEITEEPTKGKDLTEIWNYETFRQYLVGITRGPDFSPKKEEFPKEIELNGDWHKTLNDIRRSTNKDGLEKWAGIGYKTNGVNQKAIYLPNFLAIGLYDQVSSEIIAKERARMKQQAGIEGLIGDIHSHPRGLLGRLTQKIRALDDASFSVGDLYCLLDKFNGLLLMGLVEGSENLFVFRSRQSALELVDSNLMSQGSFEENWYESNGWVYRGTSSRRIPLFPISPTATNLADIADKIVTKHQLVLYRGHEGRNLVKVTA